MWFKPTDGFFFYFVEDGPVEDTVQLYILSLDSSDDSTVKSFTITILLTLWIRFYSKLMFSRQ